MTRASRTWRSGQMAINVAALALVLLSTDSTLDSLRIIGIQLGMSLAWFVVCVVFYGTRP